MELRSALPTTGLVLLGLSFTAALVSCAGMPGSGTSKPAMSENDQRTAAYSARMLEEGRQTFRYDTFGSEAFWGNALHLHEAIAGSANGGVGPGVSPKTALAVGLKVDADALPVAVVEAIKAGKVNLDDPATTLTLLKLNAVVGVTGHFDGSGKITSMGVQCSLCHSTVDDSFAPGIGKRLDGWANRDLNVGAIVSLAPNLSPIANLLGVDVATVKKVLGSWGPGKYDAELTFDGKAFRPDGKPAATLIPSAFGLLGVNNHTWTGAWGGVTYWNAYVAITQMHGQGTFFDPRLADRQRYPVGARSGEWNRHDAQDMTTAKLGALQYYQLSLPVPTPPQGAFDAARAKQGEALFKGKARCATCHVPPIFTEPGWNLHTAEEIGIDDFQAKRAPDGRYRTEPLRALANTSKLHKGGYYHDGRFATLNDVVNHYDQHFGLRLSATEKAELVEYLKSL